MIKSMAVAAIAVFGTVLIVGACASSQNAPTPTPTVSAQAQPTDVPLLVQTVWTGHYKTDIQPIFDQYCVQCHGPNRTENGLRLDSYDGVMKGTRNGPVVIPGQPTISTIISVIEGTTAPAIAMPHEGQRLSPNRIANIRGWIQAGAKND